MEAILSELRAVCDSLPTETFDRVTARLNAHGRIFFSAAGRSGLMLRALAMRLAQMGRTVYVAGDTATPAIGDGDLLVIASASGRTESVCRHARKAKQCGAEVLVITATEDSPLTEIQPADVCLRVGGSRQVMGSLFEQSLLIFGDALILHMNADEAGMKRRHANLE